MSPAALFGGFEITTMEPNRKEMLALAEYLKGLADGMNNERIRKAAEALEDAGKHVCAQGYYGCYMGDKCTSDHK